MRVRAPTSEERSEQMASVAMMPGHTECGHCHGHGSSLKDPEGVDVCTCCRGAGFLVFVKEVQDGTHSTC